jgi:hypothetical protein
MGASYGMERNGGFGCSAAYLVRVPFADAWIGFADTALDAWRAVGTPLTHRTSGVQMFEPRWMHFVLCVFVVRFTLSTSRRDSLRIKKLRRLG